MPRNWIRASANFLLDLLLPILGGILAVSWFNQDLLKVIKTHVIGNYASYTPSDFGGTVWFYWWFHEAVSKGKSWIFTDEVCAPEGVGLGTNFPQWIDAALAYPFFDFLPFPENLNLFSLSIPIMGAAAAYYGFRSLFKGRMLSLSLALMYGFNPYSFYELSRGRPVTAIIICLPLFVGAWTMALKTKGRKATFWMLLSALGGALSVYYYVLFALLLAAFAAITGLFRFIAPEEGIKRRRAPIIVITVALLGLVFSAGYFHQVIVLQPRLPGMAIFGPEELKEQPIRGFWDPTLWDHLKQSSERLSAPKPGKHGAGRNIPLAPSLREGWLISAQKLSLPYDFIYKTREFGPKPPEPFIPWVATALAFLLLPLGGRRAFGWLALAFFYYAFALGPYVCIDVVPPNMEPLRIGGHLIPGPIQILYKAIPEASHFFWPYRTYPMVLLSVLCALGLGISAITSKVKRARGPWASFVVAALLVGLMTHAYGDILKDNRVGNLTIRNLQERSPFLVELNKMEEDIALIELPLGAGRLSAEFQLLHGKKRADNQQDYIGAIASQTLPPPECFSNPYLQGLWFLGLDQAAPEKMYEMRLRGTAPPPPGEEDRGILPPGTPKDYKYQPSLSRRAFEGVRKAGFTHIIMYHATYEALKRHQITINQTEVRSNLVALYGEPSYSDWELTAWDIRGIDLKGLPEGEPEIPGSLAGFQRQAGPNENGGGENIGSENTMARPHQEGSAPGTSEAYPTGEVAPPPPNNPPQ